ncbi:MAG: response regulator [bacterium]|nr:response regulator [bacterium]
MTAILIVDDDKNFLLSLVDGLQVYKNYFEVLTAENGREAVRVLESKKIALMITDLKMPEMDGFQLLAYMVTHHPEIPVIVMTAFVTPEREDELMNLGSFKFLEKPLDFNVLVAKIFEGMEASTHYFTKVVSLCSFLKTLEIEKKTCTITVKSKGRMGYLYFFNGELTEGETDYLQGEEAIADIVTWEAAEVEIEGKSERINAKKLSKGKEQVFNHIVLEQQKKARAAESAKSTGPTNPAIAENPTYAENPAKTPPIAKPSQTGSDSSTTGLKVTRLNQSMDILVDDLGSALLGAAIMSRSDGQILVDYKSAKVCAIFNRITMYLVRALEESNLPNLGKYYLVHLEGKKAIVVIPQVDVELAILVNLKKVTLGLLLNVTLPKIIEAFEKAAK